MMMGIFFQITLFIVMRVEKTSFGTIVLVIIKSIKMTAADKTVPFQFTGKAFTVKSVYAFTVRIEQNIR